MCSRCQAVQVFLEYAPELGISSQGWGQVRYEVNQAPNELALPAGLSVAVAGRNSNAYPLMYQRPVHDRPTRGAGMQGRWLGPSAQKGQHLV